MAKGTLYLSYYGRQRKAKGLIVSVSRFPPAEARDYSDYMPIDLGPSEELLSDWKHKRIPWATFTKRYYNEIGNSPKAMKALKTIQSALRKGKDITIMCHEVKGHCHRYLIGELFKGLKYKVEEIL